MAKLERISIFQFFKIAAMELKIYTSFGLSDSTRLAMSKSTSTVHTKFRYLNPRLCYYYSWFEKTDIRHIGTILPFSIWPIDRQGYWHFAPAYQIWIV